MTQWSEIATNLAKLLRYDAAEPLIFNSGVFLILFALFMVGYWALSRGDGERRVNWRIAYVVAFSLYFYYKSSGGYFVILLLVSIYDFLIGYQLFRTRRQRNRSALLALSIVLNLATLGYFKYTNLLVESLNGLFGEGFMEFQNIFLPVGISFFLFQSISYTFDIYRCRIEPLKRWQDYLFYLSFFPQLVAGPIVRATQFVPQIRRPLRVSNEMFSNGLFLILTGLFKKAVIGDYISLNFVDRVFDEPLLYSGFDSLMAIYGYALQIYCDFSGYSDMAIGLALLMGFHFPKNFDAPYKSASITEFWRRWHISLSSWLKDYLYISLGGGRKGRARQYANLMITMVLGGLWHGAAVRFLLWGALHGVALALHKVWLRRVRGAQTLGSQMSRKDRVVGCVVTFHIVCFGWLLFRAESMEIVGVMLRQIVGDFQLDTIPSTVVSYAPIFALMALGYTLHLLPQSFSEWGRGVVLRSPFVVQVAMIVAMVWLVMQVKSADIQPFIYFQF